MIRSALVVLVISALVGCDHGRTGRDGGNQGDMVWVESPNGASCDTVAADKPTSSGSDFYVPVPSVQFPANGACFALYLANTSDAPVTVGVEHGSSSLDPQTFGYVPSGSGQAITYTPLTGGIIPAGEVAILFLNRAPGFSFPGTSYDCPPGVVPAINGVDAAVAGTGRGNAFHVTTTGDVAAYDIYPYGGGMSEVTSATLLFPSTTYETNYVAVDAIGEVTQLASFWIQIVGREDGTQVSIRPSNDIAGGAGVDPTAKGVAHTYTVNRGEVMQILQDQPLVGSVIQSSAPVGLWGGKASLGIDGCCLDSAHQQIPPVRAWGSEYVGVRYRDRYEGRVETPPWRLVGAVAGTKLTWHPSAPPGAPSSLEEGTVAEFRGGEPFVVRSQDREHPFYLAAHMNGAEPYDPQHNDGRGDAEWVNVVPTGEFASSYVFFTDPTYSETNLVLVRQRCDSAYADVTLDCAGPITGWQPIDDGTYEYAHVDLVRGNFESQNGCNNGRHEISSPRPFALTVWGWGSGATGQKLGPGFYTQYASYAYPGGANLDPINNVVVVP